MEENQNPAKASKGPLNLVKEFHFFSGHPIGERLQVLTEERGIERVGYMVEEVGEFAETTAKDDFEGALDAIMDLLYFAYGTLVEKGVSQELSKEAFAEVHRANMTKFCQTEQEALDSVQLYHNGLHPQAKDKIFEHATYRKQENLWVVYDGVSKKILKSYKTEKPNLAPIIQRYQL